jgi:hypothetical protein
MLRLVSDTAAVRGSWSQCMRESGTNLSMNRTPGDVTLAPHPDPLPIGWGEGEDHRMQVPRHVRSRWMLSVTRRTNMPVLRTLTMSPGASAALDMTLPGLFNTFRPNRDIFRGGPRNFCMLVGVSKDQRQEK